MITAHIFIHVLGFTRAGWDSKVSCPRTLLQKTQCFNPLPNEKVLDLSILEAFADDKSKVAKIMRCPLDRIGKTLWEKVKMLVTRIFSFSYNAFKSPLLYGR